MKKLTLLIMICLCCTTVTRKIRHNPTAFIEQTEQTAVTNEEAEPKILASTHATHIEEIAAQKCKEAQEDVIDEAKGMVFDPAYLQKQKDTLDQCREAGLLLNY